MASSEINPRDLAVEVTSAGPASKRFVRIIHTPSGEFGAGAHQSQLRAREIAMLDLRGKLGLDLAPTPSYLRLLTVAERAEDWTCLRCAKPPTQIQWTLRGTLGYRFCDRHAEETRERLRAAGLLAEEEI